MEFEDLEKKLNRLPRASQSRPADLKFRFKLFSLKLRRQLGYWRSFFNLKFLPMKLVIVAIALIFFFTGTASYAYFSSNVTYGKTLYSLKKTMEEIKLSQAKTPLDQVVVYTDLAGRRLVEAKTLMAKQNQISRSFIPAAQAADREIANSNDPLSITINEMINNTNKAIKVSEKITDTASAEKALAMIDQSENNQNEGLKSIAEAIGPSAEAAPVVAQALDETTANNVKIKNNLDQAKIKIQNKEKVISLRIKTRGEEDNDKEKKMEEEEKSGKTEQIKTDLNNNLGEVKTKIATIKAELNQAGVPALKTEKLFGRLNEKLSQAKAALANNNLRQANGLIQSLKSLTNNAKHFLKQKEKDILEKSEAKVEDENKIGAESEQIEKSSDDDWENQERLITPTDREQREGNWEINYR
jgi:hypothetical protein